MRSRIFLKLLITLLLGFSVIVLVMFFVINNSFQQGFLNYLQQKETHRTEGMREFLIQQYQQHNSWKFMQHNHELWIDALDSASIEIPPHMRGRPHHRPPHRPPPSNRPPPFDKLPVQQISTPLERRISLKDSNKNLVFGPDETDPNGIWIPLIVQKETIGWLYLHPTDLAGDQLASSFIEQQQKSFLFMAAIVLLLSVVMAALWARLLLRPVNKVIKAVDELSAGNYDTRVIVKGQDELAKLAINFNDMAKALQQNESLRRQWLADISHELRTPVAIIRGEIEALLDGIRKPTIDRLTSIEEEILSLTQIIEDLHQLALADNDALDVQFSECNLYDLLDHQVQLFQPRMLSKSLTLSLETKPQSNCIVSIDQRRIIQVISNILENSLRYTDSGGNIKVKLQESNESLTDNKSLHIIITDTTPSVDKSELEKIFERLYCVDKSRSRNAGGSGLGLSICKSIVNAHDGHIHASHSEEGGLKIDILIPSKHI